MTMSEIERYEPHTGADSKKDDDTERLDILVEQCHRAGMTQGETARELRVSRWAVRKSAERRSLDWPNAEHTAAATKAAAAKARRERTKLLERWQDMANDQLDSAETEQLPDLQQRAIVMAGIATDKSVALAKLSTIEPDDDGMEDGVRSLDMLMSTVKQSASLMELARKLGATDEQLEQAHRGESFFTAEERFDAFPDDH